MVVFTAFDVLTTWLRLVLQSEQKKCVDSQDIIVVSTVYTARQMGHSKRLSCRSVAIFNCLKASSSPFIVFFYFFFGC